MMRTATATSAPSGSSNSSGRSRRRPLAASATTVAAVTVTALAGLLLLSPAEGFMGPARSLVGGLSSSCSRQGSRPSSSSRVAVGAGRNEEWETNNGEQMERDTNPWATQQHEGQQQQQQGSDNDWYMTGRIHYLREMEK